MKVMMISLLEEINPLGLLHVATYLATQGHEVATLFGVINPKEGGNRRETERVISDAEVSQVVDLILQMRPELIGVSLMTIHYHSAVKLTRQLRRSCPGTPILWGGIHPTLSPEECLQEADIVCRGEGELPVLELIRRMEAGQDYRDIPNLWFQGEAGIIRNDLRPLLQDLDAFPYPRFDWDHNYVMYQGEIRQLDVKNYYQSVPRRGQIYDVMAHRGCPHACNYCCNASFKELYQGKGKLIRRRGIDNIIQELLYVKETFKFVKLINFQDDVFITSNRDGWLERFSFEYKEKIGLSFICKASPIDINEEIITILKRAGLEHLQIGIQGSDRCNREIYNRRGSHSQFIEASKVLRKYNIAGRYDIIMDDPFANDEDMLQILVTLTELERPFWLNCFSMTFFPNTNIFHMARERGLLDKAKDGYSLKATLIKRNYLNELIAISPRMPNWLVRFFIRHRGKRFSQVLLKIFIYSYYFPITWLMYQASRYPEILAFIKRIHFCLLARERWHFLFRRDGKSGGT